MKIRVGFGLGVRTSFNDGTLRRPGRLPRTPPLRQPLALGADQRARSRSGGRPGVRRRSDPTPQVRHVRHGPARPQPAVGGQGAGHAGSTGSSGRLLPAFGLGAVDPREQQAFGVQRGERAAWFDEALPLIRRLWLEDSVDHDGERFHLRDARVRPKPHQSPTGRVARRHRTVGAPSGRSSGGRVAPVLHHASTRPPRDGCRWSRWPPTTTAHIDPEHFGALVPYATGPLPDALVAGLAARRPDVDPTDLVAQWVQRAVRSDRRFISTPGSRSSSPSR